MLTGISGSKTVRSSSITRSRIASALVAALAPASARAPSPLARAVGPVHLAHVAHSVVAGARLPCSAARSVCQASVAHFTRTGNSRTPAKTASLPSPRRPAPASPDRRSRAGGSARTSARPRPRVLPFTLSVISDAEAVEIAQPEPSKATSSTTSSSTRQVHRELVAAQRVVALGAAVGARRLPKFRGVLLWSRITAW